MKLMPLVVSTRPIPAADLEDHGIRPMETEADLIAAAAPRGEKYNRWLFEIELDEHDQARDTEDGICIACDWLNEDVFDRVEMARRVELLRLGLLITSSGVPYEPLNGQCVPYDPTIRL